MKNILIIAGVIFAGTLFAKPEDIFSRPAGDRFAGAPLVEDVLIVAQQEPPRDLPGVPGGRGGGGPVQVQTTTGAPAPVGPPGSVSVGGGGFGQRLAGVVQRVDGGAFAAFDDSARPVLLVGFAKLDHESRQHVQEDMQIMSRILNKAATKEVQNQQERRMGITVTTLNGNRSENLFIEDYGPIFIMNVPMPLSGARQADSKKEEKGDSEWEEAKRELYQNKPFTVAEPMKYDPKSVEALKTAILESLKNAANIRQFKSDQTLTIVVTGGDSTRAVFAKRIVKKNDYQPGKEEVHNEVFEQKAGGPQQTTLTIRVKKSDIDAFARGKMDVGEFAKKAIITTN